MTGQVLESDRHLNLLEDMPKSAARGWRAGDLVIDLELRRVQCGGERLVLQDTPFRLLCLLLEREGRPVSRRDMHHALWPRYDWDSFERNLNTAVRKLRRAIGDDAREPRLIETLRASGYRWIGPPPRELTVSQSIEIPARLAGDRQMAPTAALANRWKRHARIGGLLAGALAIALLAALWPARNAQPWLVVDTADAVGGTIDGSAEARSIAALLHDAIEGDAANNGNAVHVALSIDGGVVSEATIAGLGGTEKVAIADAAFGRERLLAALAERLPAQVLKPAKMLLPEDAQRAYAEAGTLLVGAAGIEPVERAIGLLESTLSAAPSHSGALRAYASAQRTQALLARDPVAARDRRFAARAALRRAVVADPRSAAVAADVAYHLYWAEWNPAQAADWYALARREAPQDADILRDYAWFALADERIGEAMTAMNAALAIAPLSVPLHSDLGWFLFRTGHYDDALRQCRIALEMSATDNSAQICEERALAELGRFSDAWQALRRHAPAWLDAVGARTFAALGPEAAYRAAMHLAARKTRERIGAGFDSAELEAIAGDRAAADADLAAASALGDPGLHLAPVTPELVHLLGESEALRLAGGGAGSRVAATPMH